MRLFQRLQTLILLCLVCSFPCPGWGAENAKVRAVTAFVRLHRAGYEQQIRQTLAMLRQARAAFEQAGFEVQTLRITTQPFPEYVRGLSRDEALAFFQDLDRQAGKEGFIMALGPAMTTDSDDPRQAELLARILATSANLDASLMVAAEDGVHWNGVVAAAKLVKSLSQNSPHSQGTFHFAAIAMVPPLTPFYPGSYVSGPGHAFGVALESANVVAETFAITRDPRVASQALEKALGAQAGRVEEIARDVEKQSGWTYAGLDLSPAPLKDVSIGAAIERLAGVKVGSSGTLTAAVIITGALAKIPVKRAGYSGLMLPVLEDSVLAERWSEGRLTLDALLAYSAVCGTGLDTVPLPGDTSADQLRRIIGDMASLAFKWHKPLSARLLPVAGKKAGERTEFNDPFLVNATIQPLP